MNLEIRSFSDIDISDSFFDSLRESYPEFDQWFAKKAETGESAYVFYNEDKEISDFLYLKIEEEEMSDVEPILLAKKRLKIGTFKLLSRGTRRGERLMKKIMDRAIAADVDEIYVTIFPTEELKYLINFFEVFGFVHVSDKTHGDAGKEWVLVKDMRNLVGEIEKDYPKVKKGGADKYLLSIRPDYHTKLFPDSILKNESYDIVQDITPTNGIYKIYICWMPDTVNLKQGDNVVIYRTSDISGQAYYRAVATSVCTAVEVKQYGDFDSLESFMKYTQYSVFTEKDRRYWFQKKNNFIVIKMLYNVAFTKRVIRKDLLEQVGISSDAYWGFCALTDDQYNKIIELGGADERYFVD